MNVAAQALEQSVLETKDKEQLLAIAKALGLKVTARSKKADIIDGILASTGTPDAAPAPAATTTCTDAEGISTKCRFATGTCTDTEGDQYEMSLRDGDMY